ASASPASRRRDALLALVALSGPVAWMAWNAHAHDGPLHFLGRVTRFRQAIGAANLPLAEKILGYPRALVADMPEAVVLGLLGSIGLAAQRRFRDRWRWPALAAAGVLAFLVAGDVGDGAPTHHPARALAAVGWVFVAMGVDAIDGAWVAYSA